MPSYGSADQILFWPDQILETWRTNQRINEHLIEAISDEGLRCSLSQRGGRNVVRQFCHLHYVRYWQLEKCAPDLFKCLHTFQTHDEPGRAFLKRCLEDSNN